MNEHDRENLLFIISLNEEQFNEWYATISMDDVEYAIELCKAARAELSMNLDTVSDLSEANSILKKYML